MSAASELGMAEPPSRRVNQAEMRELFNHGGYLARLEAGELTSELERSSHPDEPPFDFPHCTRSETYRYVDSAGVEIVLVHQYTLPDDSIGASGVPDPKRLYHDGIIYRLEKTSEGHPG